MKEISKVIFEDNLNSNTVVDKERITVRGVITKDDEALMLYSSYFDDYTFPGGGIKENEDMIESLLRELNEEIGAVRISNVVPFGKIKEVKYTHKKDSSNTYIQTSYYYKLEVDEFGKPNPVVREQLQGIEARWIKYRDALEHNNKVMNDEKHQQKGIKTALSRENAVLMKLMEEYNNEKI